MIYAKFDQGWQHVAAAEMQDQVIEEFFENLLHNNSRNVLINNTWYEAEFNSKGNFLGNSDKFKNTVNNFIKKYGHEIDNVIVYSLVDPIYSKPESGFDHPNVIKVGYYPHDGVWIDLHAMLVEKYFKIDSNIDYTEKNIDTAFMCLNGKPHPHREQLVKSLIDCDLVESNLVTFSGSQTVPALTIPENYTKKEGINSDPFDAMTLGDINNWNRHFLNIVTETVWDVEADGFWSEKIFKPIIGKRPFLVYAPAGATNMLTKHGFEHYCNDFTDITDLDLTNPDNIPDFLVQLNQQGKWYLKYKLGELQEKIDYNHSRFYRYVKNQKTMIQHGYKKKITHHDFDNTNINHDCNHEIFLPADYDGIFFNLFDPNEFVKLHTHKVVQKSFLPGEKIKDIVVADKTAIYTNLEMIDPTTKALSSQGHYTVVGSMYTDQSLDNSCFFPWHLYQTQHVNQQKPINSADKKKYLADVLLGNGKPHRIDFFEQLKQSKDLLENCLVNLHQQSGINHGHEVYSSPALAALELPDVLKIKNNNTWNSTEQISHKDRLGHTAAIFLSQVIPEKIYQNSYLSVVSETLIENDHFFPTEKIAKPIIAGRIFLVSAGKNYLANLRSLGFKTFGSIIDESYDQCEDSKQRNSAIIAELKRLQKMDIVDLYRKALPMLEHNQQLIYSKELWQPAREFVEQIFRKHRK